MHAGGVAGHGGYDKTVCVCFSIGERAIKSAIGSGRICTIADIATEFRAGTNCGGCIQELKDLLHAGRPETPKTGTLN